MIKKINIIVIILVLYATSMPVFAWFDTIIQRVWESLRPKETINNLNKWLLLGNIYSNAYQLAKKEFLSTTVQALNAMTDDLNYRYACELTTVDSTNILITIDTIRNDLQAMAAAIYEVVPWADTNSFNTSCTKLIRCASKKYKLTNDIVTSNVTDKTSYLTEQWFLTCKNLAQESYLLNVAEAANRTQLTTTNVGSDIYYNWTLEDSPYDILLDIQRVWDVLFSTNEKTPKVLFYTFPNNSVAWLQPIAFDGQSRYTTYIPPTTQSTINNTLQTQSNWSSSTSNSTIWNSTTQTSQTQSTAVSSTYNANVNPIYVDTTNTPTNWGVIDNYACTPNDTWWDNNTGTWSWRVPIDHPAEEDDTQPTISIYDTISSTWPIFDINTPYYSQPANDVDLLWNWDNFFDPDSYDAQAAAIYTCTSKCNSLRSIDKAMCIAKCTCGTTRSRNGMFWLSICTIPTRQTDIVSSKPVQSIEEIVTEINNVLNNLKQSWQLMKHTKPKEFLDTSLSKIKLSQIFAFDINVSFKPILDKKPRRQSDAEYENNTDNLLRWNYWNIDIAEEKNKYIALMWETDAIGSQTVERNSLDTIQSEMTKNLINQQSRHKEIEGFITNSLVNSQNAEVNDIIRQFLEQNIRFWTFLNESLQKIQQTSDSLKQKIERWK